MSAQGTEEVQGAHDFRKPQEVLLVRRLGTLRRLGLHGGRGKRKPCPEGGNREYAKQKRHGRMMYMARTPAQGQTKLFQPQDPADAQWRTRRRFEVIEAGKRYPAGVGGIIARSHGARYIRS